MTINLKQERHIFLLNQYHSLVSKIVALLDDVLTNNIKNIQDDIIKNGEATFQFEQPISLHEMLEYVAFTNEPEYLAIIEKYKKNGILITTNIDDFKDTRIIYERYNNVSDYPIRYTIAPELTYITFTYLTDTNGRENEQLRYKYNAYYSDELSKYSTYDYLEDPGISNAIARTFRNVFRKISH